MTGTLSATYFASYQLAIGRGKKAERTFRYERGLTESNFIQFGYWDSLRKGLLAGDQLHLALLQMEAAYTDQNVREYEISRDVSLLQCAARSHGAEGDRPVRDQPAGIFFRCRLSRAIHAQDQERRHLDSGHRRTLYQP